MTELSIEVDAGLLGKLFRRLGRVRSFDTLRPPMVRATAALQSDLQEYPAATHRRQPAKSRRQQIKQIMLGKEGKIPYRRTMDLSRSWTAVVDESDSGIEGIVGNAVRSRETGTRYGPLVQGEGPQAAYHRGTWQTDEQVIARQRAGIIDDFMDAIDDALSS